MKRAIVFLMALGACDPNKEYREERQRAWEGPCADVSSLLATTSGSPNEFKCPNRLHHMRVQVATSPSNEEAAALVFCECERDGGP